MTLRQAKRLYEDFRDRPPTRAKRVSIRFPKALVVMGHVDFIGYRTTHRRNNEGAIRATHYKHDFAPGSKPLLCADPKTGRLYLVGGRYRVTGRGIVDRDAKGREIE
jgi:hypothetical protein